MNNKTTKKSDEELARDMEIVMNALKGFALQEGDAFPRYVCRSPENPNELVADYNLGAPVGYAQGAFPFPSRKVSQAVSDETKNLIEASSLSKLAFDVLFVQMPIFTPIIALLTTGIPDRKIVLKLEGFMKQIEEEYTQKRREAVMQKLGLNENDFSSSSAALDRFTIEEQEAAAFEFLQSPWAQEKTHAFLHFRNLRDHARRTHRARGFESWPVYSTSIYIYMYYDRLIALLQQYVLFKPEHDVASRVALAKIFNDAHDMYVQNKGRLTTEILERAPLKEAIDEIHYQIEYFGRVNDWNHPAIRKCIDENHFVNACIDFTRGLLQVQEKWLLYVCDVPDQAHDVLYSTTQPLPSSELFFAEADKQAIRDLINQHDYLKMTRVQALSDVWSPATFSTSKHAIVPRSLIKNPINAAPKTFSANKAFCKHWLFPWNCHVLECYVVERLLRSFKVASLT